MDRQSTEFALRSRVFTPVELLRQRRGSMPSCSSRRAGIIAPGALTDVVAICGNPLDNISILEQHGRIGLIMRDGKRSSRTALPQPERDRHGGRPSAASRVKSIHCADSTPVVSCGSS